MAKLNIQNSKVYFLKTVILDETTMWSHMVISINRNQEKKAETKHVTDQKNNKKTRKKKPVFNCSCGTKILVVPDLPAMNKAIEKHLIEHEMVTGQSITEEFLAQKILNVIIKSLSSPV